MENILTKLKSLTIKCDTVRERKIIQKKKLFKQIKLEVRIILKEILTRRGATKELQRELSRTIAIKIMKKHETKVNKRKIKEFTEKYIEYLALKRLSDSRRNGRQNRQ